MGAAAIAAVQGQARERRKKKKKQSAKEAAKEMRREARIEARERERQRIEEEKEYEQNLKEYEEQMAKDRAEVAERDAAEREAKYERRQKELHEKTQKFISEIQKLIDNQNFQGVVDCTDELLTVLHAADLLPLQVQLYLAIRYPQHTGFKYLEFLLKSNPNINNLNFLCAPLSIAVLFSSPYIMDYLLKEKIDRRQTDQPSGTHPFFHAISVNNSEKLQWFFDKDINVTLLRDATGLTALHYAAYAHNHEAMVYLISQHADINAVDLKGLTPIQYLTLGPDSIKCLDLLLKNGAIPRASSLTSFECIEYMLLFIAKKQNPTEIMDFLASVPRDHLPNLLTSSIRHSDIWLFNLHLEKCNPDVNALNQYGNTVLVEAVTMNNEAMVCALIKSNANPVLQNEKWDALLERTPNPQIRKFLNENLLKQQLPAYREKVLSENPCCFWKFSSGAPAKRIRAADALTVALEGKSDAPSLTQFRKQFQADSELNAMKDRFERFVTSIATLERKESKSKGLECAHIELQARQKPH